MRPSPGSAVLAREWPPRFRFRRGSRILLCGGNPIVRSWSIAMESNSVRASPYATKLAVAGLAGLGGVAGVAMNRVAASLLTSSASLSDVRLSWIDAVIFSGRARSGRGGVALQTSSRLELRDTCACWPAACAVLSFVGIYYVFYILMLWYVYLPAGTALGLVSRAIIVSTQRDDKAAPSAAER